MIIKEDLERIHKIWQCQDQRQEYAISKHAIRQLELSWHEEWHVCRGRYVQQTRKSKHDDAYNWR